jgi:thymidylate synthase (FAD)
MLLYSPEVFVIARTEICESALLDWALYNDFARRERLVADLPPVERLVYDEDADGAARVVEFAGRHCYRSWDKGRTPEDYIRNIIDVNHGSVLEHANFTFAIQGVSRSLSHELVRHRVGVAISQESQRYVEASDANFVIPPILMADADESPDITAFEASCKRDVEAYNFLVPQLEAMLNARHPEMFGTTRKKKAREAARSLMPNATETRLTWTANVRTLRHVFDMRGSLFADLEIRRLACRILEEMKAVAPIFFEDFIIVDGDFGVNAIKKLT